MNPLLRVLFLLALGAALPLGAQPYTSGATYFGTDGFIEYQAGDMPLIISVPHGGYLTPSDLPDRDCDGCSYVQDAYTQELARVIREAFAKRTGCLPHVVLNLLHRKKLDMNRDVLVATDSNDALTRYWNEYHMFIDSAKSRIVRTYGKGLFIDLHGHGHTKPRIEFGYLLDDSQLRESDSVLATAKVIAVSSIRNLVGTNRGSESHAELLRGEHSLGTLFVDQGYPGVPSKPDPFPLVDDPYFNGGYNTLKHGSRQDGSIDAIQMELNSSLRFTASARAAFAEAFSDVLRTFLDLHYLDGFATRTCFTSSTGTDGPSTPIDVPRVVGDEVSINGLPAVSTPYRVSIVDAVGSEVLSGRFPGSSSDIELRHLPSGVYGLRILTDDGLTMIRTTILVVR